jgi:hypothetical protein
MTERSFVYRRDLDDVEIYSNNVNGAIIEAIF